jgi:hypothetical protein
VKHVRKVSIDSEHYVADDIQVLIRVYGPLPDIPVENSWKIIFDVKFEDM